MYINCIREEVNKGLNSGNPHCGLDSYGSG